MGNSTATEIASGGNPDFQAMGGGGLSNAPAKSSMWGNIGSGAAAGLQYGGAAAGSGMSKGASAGFGGTAGAIQGGLAGGPVGAVAGGILGAATGALGGGDEGNTAVEKYYEQKAARAKDIRQQLYADPKLTPYAGSNAPLLNYTLRKRPEEVLSSIKKGELGTGKILQKGVDTRRKLWEMQSNPTVLGAKITRNISYMVPAAVITTALGAIRFMLGPKPR
jgi:hypothetical protein